MSERDMRQEIMSLRSRYREEAAIVGRIWSMYGDPTYEQLKGLSIYDLITQTFKQADCRHENADIKGFSDEFGMQEVSTYHCPDCNHSWSD